MQSKLSEQPTARTATLKHRSHWLFGLSLQVLVLSGASVLLGTACALTGNEIRPATQGMASNTAALERVVDENGPVTLESINACDWMVDRKGLINLNHPEAIKAGLKPGLEPIQIYFHVIRHPTYGTFIVDTGMEKAMRDDPKKALIHGPIARFLKTDTMKVNVPMAEWLKAEKEPIKGVFLTHMHLDHLTGMPDIPSMTPVYNGPGEAHARTGQNAAVRRMTDAALNRTDAVLEWPFVPDASARFEGVIDVFGDGSVWALWVPGHTPGSTAYLVRTTQGPVLLTGDACHTRWGWEHGVEPGEFSANQAQSAISLKRMKDFVALHPKVLVHPGHQR